MVAGHDLGVCAPGRIPLEDVFYPVIGISDEAVETSKIRRLPCSSDVPPVCALGLALRTRQVTVQQKGTGVTAKLWA
jgi:hypothetical protein